MGKLYKRRCMKFYRPGEDRKRKKMTKRNMCKAAILLKKVRDQSGSIVSYTTDYVNLNHNHKLLPSQSKQFECNKQLNSLMVEFIGAMQGSRSPRHCIVDMVSNMHDGPECIPMTHKDITNM
jgi:hypothetical protein